MAVLTDAAPPPARRPFRSHHARDRNAFAVLTACVWFGIVAGFGGDITQHLASHAPAYPVIVHVHAVAFVGWLVLFTVQVALIRAGRSALHRRLGIAMLGLAAVMAVLGPATAIIVQHAQLGTAGADPAFLSVQLTDILGFAGLVTAGALLRHDAPAHKRLLMLSLLGISGAGFARFMAPAVGPLFPNPFVSDFMANYLGSDLLVAGFGAYDLATRGRLHPAYVAGAAWLGALHLGATWLHLSPAWKLTAIRLAGG